MVNKEERRLELEFQPLRNPTDHNYLANGKLQNYMRIRM